MNGAVPRCWVTWASRTRSGCKRCDTIIINRIRASRSIALPPAQRLAQMLCVVDRYAAMISPRQSREGRSATESAQDILNDDNARNRMVGQTLVHVVGLFPPGTFVQLDDGTKGVVLRSGRQDNRPDVAIVLNGKGQLIRPPSLHVAATAALPSAPPCPRPGYRNTSTTI